MRRKQFKKKILSELSKDRDWQYYRAVEAHRTFMQAQSLYKHLRFGNTQPEPTDDEEDFVPK